ncbi:MAG: formylglycine-generating enzyme family protein [Lentisphaerae bacterium]|nr:formylglycine-generating enzyme family protein [Lentisphaerota bacterium]
MKKLITIACLIGGGAIFADVATVSNVSIEQPTTSRKVTIKYKLSKPAVITVDIQTNCGENAWASIGAENFTTMWKDVNRLVKPAADGGFNEILWRPDKDWNGHKLDAGSVKAVVTAWAEDATPDYMAVSLTSNSNVFYYVSAEAVPGGVTDNRYKTDWLLMRKIPAAGVTWRMGIAPADTSLGNNSSWANAHLVQLSADYYIGVYPVTQKQYAMIGGQYRKGAPSDNNAGDMKPAGGLDWGYLRGGTWPGDPLHSSANEAILKFRNRTGIEFDLPTEAQWEFACRAGSGDCLYTGKAWTVDNLNEIAWYASNTTHLVEVGLKKPNDFGLYDMIGNVYETCLDYWDKNNRYTVAEDGGPVMDPEGVEAWSGGSSSQTWPHVIRGGAYDYGMGYQSSHDRAACNAHSSWVPARIGFRLMAPMGGKW